MKNFIENILSVPIKNFLKFLIKNRKYKTLKIHRTSTIDIFSTIGEFVTIGKTSTINNCKIGSYTYFASDCKFFNTEIGKFCSIGPGVRSGMGIHPSNTFVSTHPAFFSIAKQAQISFVNRNYFTELRPIKIGNDVWIGANVLILDGVKIGNGAILGAGAVITKNIPDYAIAVGVPAKVVKYRFDKREIDFLLKDQWWNKDIKWIEKNYKYFHNINDYIMFLKME